MKTLIFVTVMVLGAGAARAAEITVFAASSLKTALDEIAADWALQTGHVARISYDSSAKLALQIEEGAPADLFFSAAENWMDVLAKGGLIKTGSRRAALGNALVLVAEGRDHPPVTIGKGFDLPGLLAGGKLAMGQVSAVPVGQYGLQALRFLGMWDLVAPQVVEAENARATLALVGRGEAGFGIVFRSDAVADDLAGDAVSVVGTFPEDSHAPIIHSLALTATAGPVAAEFAAYLQAPAADAVFASLGFSVLP